MAMDMNAALKITASVNGGAAIDQLKSSMDRLDSSSRGAAGGFGLLKSAVGGFIALQGVQAIAGFAKSAIDAGDQLQKMSAKTGVAVQTLGELKYAGDLAGASIEQIQSAMTKLSVKATDAASGNKTAAAAFEALGIKVLDANGRIKTQIQLLEEASNAIKGISDPTVKAAMAVELFGKSGAELIPFLDTMQEAREEAVAMGVVFGSDFARSAEQFNDNITRMQSLLSGLTVQILNSVIPGVNRLMERMISAGKESKSFFGAIQAGAHQMVLEAGTDFKRLDEEITRVQQKLGRLEDMRRDLTKPTLANSINNAFGGDLSTVNAQIDMAKEQIKQLKAAKDALAKPAPAVSGNAGSSNTGSDPLAKLNALKAADEAAKKAASETASMEKQRTAILQGLNDKLVTLTQSEADLTIVKLRRLGASEKELESARRLINVTVIAEVGARKAKDAEDALEAKQRERNSTLASLRDEVLKLKEGEDALTVSKMQALGATKEEIAQLVELQKQHAGLTTAKEQEKQSAKDLKEENELVARSMQDMANEGKRVFDQTRTPAEKLALEIERISSLLETGAIDWDTYNRAIKGAQDEFKGLGKSSTDMFAGLEKTIQGWGKSSADAIVDFALTGKMSFGDMASSIISDMLKMIVYQQIMKPIFDMLGASVGNFMSSGGGASFGVPMPTMAAKGMAFDGAVQQFAAGGVFSTATPFKFASGGMMRNGVMGEAGPEAIMPLKRGADGKLGVAGAGGGSTSVVVNNYGDKQASVQEKMDSRGNRRIEVTIGELVANEVRRAGSAAHSSVRDTFGARPALVGR